MICDIGNDANTNGISTWLDITSQRTTKGAEAKSTNNTCVTATNDCMPLNLARIFSVQLGLHRLGLGGQHHASVSSFRSLFYFSRTPKLQNYRVNRETPGCPTARRGTTSKK